MSNIKGKSFPTPKDIPAFPKMSKKRKYHFLKVTQSILRKIFTGQQRQFLLQTFLIRLKLHKAMTGQSLGPGWNHNYGQSAKL